MLDIFSKRFDDLYEDLSSVELSKKYENYQLNSGYYVDKEIFLNWRVRARHLISSACGIESVHYKQFIASEKPKSFGTTHDQFIELRAVFSAAREDYKGGYCNSIKNIIQSELFNDEMDQSSELLDAGYISASAVIAGVVLETRLRQMCQDRALPLGKLDRMNSDLVRSGAYNILVQKRITAIADIRNSAAHGNIERFSREDVSDMIIYVRRFLEEHS